MIFVQNDCLWFELFNTLVLDLCIFSQCEIFLIETIYLFISEMLAPSINCLTLNLDLYVLFIQNISINFTNPFDFSYLLDKCFFFLCIVFFNNKLPSFLRNQRNYTITHSIKKNRFRFNISYFGMFIFLISKKDLFLSVWV